MTLVVTRQENAQSFDLKSKMEIQLMESMQPNKNQSRKQVDLL